MSSPGAFSSALNPRVVLSAWQICLRQFPLTAAFLLLSDGVVFAANPTLPRVFVDTTEATVSGQTIHVPAGGDFQAALDSAQPGDVITLEAGATFRGPFTLPNKPGTGWILVRTSASDSSLPPAGTRITPASAAALPKIVTAGAGAALAAAAGAHHFRFVAVEFTVEEDVSASNGLIDLGVGHGSRSSISTALDQVPHHLIFDRVYVHGHAAGTLRRGIAVNSAWTAIINSYIADIHAVGADSQAISGWSGPGPFAIVNNYLEAAGETVLFGGARAASPDLIPADVEIRGNHFFKPLAWKADDPAYAGTPWKVGNHLELRGARRVLVDGNLFEQNWLTGQKDSSIRVVPSSRVEDVTIVNNLVRQTGSAIGLYGRHDAKGGQRTRRILIRNNLFDDVSPRWGGAGRLFQMFEGVEDLVIDHNTGLHDGSVIYAEGTHSRFVFRNNIARHNDSGVEAPGSANALASLESHFPGCLFERNVLVGGYASLYPADNFFPSSWDEVGFVDLAGGNYRLSVGSRYRSAGTDGRDIGVDLDAIAAAPGGASQGAAAFTRPIAPDVADTVAGRLASSSPSSDAATTSTASEATDPQGMASLTSAEAATSGAVRSYSTSYSIGLEWDISNDPDHDAKVQVEYRVQSTSTWKAALPLVRVDYNGYNMLAGSILFLSPNTTYEVRLSLTDPDGGGETRTVTVATRPVPSLPTGGRTFHVVPGSGGGDGSVGNPFRGIAAAQAVAQPRDIFIVHAGNYGGRVGFTKAGTAGGGYIVWKGAGDGEATFNGINIAASYIWLEGVTVRNQTNGGTSSGAPTGVVLSRNSFINNHYGIFLNGGGSNWYIADNDIRGTTDPASESFGGEGVQLNHTSGHVIAHNRITWVADGISYPNSNIDIYGNDIFDTSDDGIEADTGRVNLRMWGNRIHNVGHNGIAFQPQDGAPWYIIRNQVVSFREAVFKFRYNTDRAVILHNTFVNSTGLINCCLPERLLASIVKNNLWVSKNGGKIWQFGSAVKDWRADLDNNGFDWGSYSAPFSYGGRTYSDLSSFSTASGLERHGIQINKTTCFATFNVPGPPPTSIPPQHMTLQSGCNAVDAGAILPNINDGFVGAAPDLGAYELGHPLPTYGPRPSGPPDTTPPSVPVGLAATTVSSSQIDLAWSASNDNVGVAGYQVYRDGTSIGTSATTTYSSTALSPSTLYTFTVAAVDAAGNASAQSAPASATTLPPPPLPSDLTIYRAPGPITIDGNLAEWGAAAAVDFSGFSNGATGRLVWDDENLYVAFRVTDAQLSATRTTRDAPDLYRDDGVEVYIDTQHDQAAAMQPDDYQVLVNLNNVQMDLRGTGGGKDAGWNASWASAVTYVGTLNDATDVDAAHIIELAIPWAQIGVIPSVGKTFGVDLVVDDSDPSGTPSYQTFDWAGIAPDSYAQPIRWKRVELGAATTSADTTPPSLAITSPSDGATVSGTIMISGTAADDVAVSRVEVQIDSEPPRTATGTDTWTLSLDSRTLSNGPHTIVARAVDSAGNAATASVSVAVSNDTTAPTISIVLPLDGAVVIGLTSVVAEASDNVAVVGVQFKLDGANLGSEVRAAPYALVWDTSGVSNGSHVLTAVARDAAGNLRTSRGVTATVANLGVLGLPH